MINKQYTIVLDCIGYLKEHTFYIEHHSGWDMILEEPGLYTAHAQMSGSKEPLTIQTPNMQGSPFTSWQRPRMRARV